MRGDQDSTSNTTGPSIGSRTGPNLTAIGSLTIAIRTASTLDKYPGQSRP
jgi:Na+/H+ antiporter NhaD/arsenite permease-like protein